MVREIVIVTLTDEDLELIGLNPEEVSDKLFNEIAEEMKEFLCYQTFSDALAESYKTALENLNDGIY